MMVRLTKTQQKRMLTDIQKKAHKLYTAEGTGIVKLGQLLTFKDVDAIDRIIQRALNRIG